MRKWASDIRKCAFALIFFATGSFAQSWDNTRPTRDLYGNSGLIDTPTAHSFQDAEVGVTMNGYYDERHSTGRGTVNFQITPRFSGSFRYTAIEDFNGRDIYLDRAFDVRYQLLQESSFRPALTIGLRDIAGTGFYSSEYIVATKTFDRFRASLGMGWGRLGEAGGFTNPLSIFGDDFETRPEQVRGARLGGTGQLDSSHWFRGDAAIFGGAQYLATDDLILTFEYSSNGYELERDEFGFDYKAPVNIGATYQFDNGIDLSAFYLHGSTVAVQLSYAFNAKNPSVFSTGHGDAPPPLTARPVYSSAQLGWDGLGQAGQGSGDVSQVSQDIRSELAGQGLELLGLNADGPSIRLRFRNVALENQARAFGRAARILARRAPNDIETFILEIVTPHGLTGQRVTFSRQDLEELEHAPDGAWKSFARADLDSGYAPTVPIEFSPDADWWSTPFLFSSVYDPRDPGRSKDVGIDVGGRLSFAPGWVVGGNVQFRPLIALEPGDASLQSTASGNVPKVRTGARQYLAETSLAMENLYLTNYFRPTENLYARGSVGYFEHMYGGVSGEVLWAPQASRLAFGAELNWVQQRAFDGGFGFQDYNIATGHVSAYLRGKNGFHFQLDAGRYLADDWGATLTVEREFANGIRLGAFATATDMSATDFGEGSFDKGIRFDIPLSALSGKRGQTRVKGTFRPVLGDGGARVIVPGRIYEEIRDTRQGKLQSQWGQVFR